MDYGVLLMIIIWAITAENLCDRYSITREEQDEFSANSQKKAAAAIEAGKV